MALTNLTDTKWAWKNILAFLRSAESISMNLTFWSNGTLFSDISLIVDSTVDTTTHELYYGDTLIIDDNTETPPADYNVIYIVGGDDVTNEAALEMMPILAVRLDINENLHVQSFMLTGECQEFDFGPVKGLEFLVKNFSDSYILVSFEDIGANTTCIKIPAETAQVVLTNLQCPRKAFSKIYVKGSGSGGVEVQVILW